MRSFNPTSAVAPSLTGVGTTRSAVTGVPRNQSPKNRMSDQSWQTVCRSDLTSVWVMSAAVKAPPSARDYVRSAVHAERGVQLPSAVGGIEPLMRAATFGSSAGAANTEPAAALELFESLGRGEPGDAGFPNSRNGPCRQAVAARVGGGGKQTSSSTRTVAATPSDPCRSEPSVIHTKHAGHCSTGTTSHYVLAELVRVHLSLAFDKCWLNFPVLHTTGDGEGFIAYGLRLFVYVVLCR